jgi:Rrf2 family protein
VRNPRAAAAAFRPTIAAENVRMISQKARYAFKALIALSGAPAHECMQARDIAASEQIPQSFLEQILLELRRAGLVGSRRGRDGGHFLLKDPADISFGEVLRLIDGPVAPLPCLSRTAYRRCHDCKDEKACVMRRGFGRAYDAQLHVLEQTSIADACADENQPRRSLIATISGRRRRPAQKIKPRRKQRK